MSLLQMSFTASVMIIVVIIIRALAINKIPKKTFLVLWGIIMIRLLVPFTLTSTFSVYTLIGQYISLDKTPVKNILPKAISDNLITNIQPYANNDSITTNTIIQNQSIDSFDILMIIWLVGMIACFMFFIFSYIHCYREFQMSFPIQNEYVEDWLSTRKMKRKILVRQSSHISSPLTYGIFHPVILIPKKTEWKNTNTLNYVLTHEYVHIKRFDSVIKIMLTLALCLHWFNPLVWAMYVLANRDIELSCDETVILTFGESIKSDYARTLISMEEIKSHLTPLCNNFSKNAIEERIRAIMKVKKATTFSLFLALVIVTSITCALATSAATPDKIIPIINIATAEHNDSQTVISIPSEQKRLTEYMEYGISFDKKEKMYFNGELVRYFMDGTEFENMTSFSLYEYLNEEGTVDIHTVRTVIDNGDGSIDPLGELTNIIKYSQEEFEQRNLADLKTTYVEATYIGDEASAVQGETLEQRFSKYESYGIEYKTVKASSIGNVYYNGQLVKQFIDESKDETFTFSSSDGGEIIVRTVYDEDGKLFRVKED